MNYDIEMKVGALAKEQNGRDPSQRLQRLQRSRAELQYGDENDVVEAGERIF